MRARVDGWVAQDEVYKVIMSLYTEIRLSKEGWVS
jgi:hypothetical protein